MRYQVSEQTRLRQITCEIFISEGLDSALNIDRESFNNAHPHSVYITKWLHSALRQLASAQKRVAAQAREKNLDASKGAALTEIQRVAADLWKQEAEDPASEPPAVVLADEGKASPKTADSYIFPRSAVLHGRSGKKTSAAKARVAILEEKLKAITQVLASFGLLDHLPKRKQERLLRAIFEILEAAEE